jgi:hypothetical protein
MNYNDITTRHYEKTDVPFAFIHLALSESLFGNLPLFHWNSLTSFQVWAGLNQAGFFTRSSISLLCVYVGFLLDLFFDTEDGGDIFIRNVGLSNRRTAL